MLKRRKSLWNYLGEIDQFRYIKIQPNTVDLSTRLLGINPTNSVVIPQSLVLRSIVSSRVYQQKELGVLLKSNL